MCQVKESLSCSLLAAMKNQAINPQNGGRAQAMLKAIFDGIGKLSFFIFLYALNQYLSLTLIIILLDANLTQMK